MRARRPRSRRGRGLRSRWRSARVLSKIERRALRLYRASGAPRKFMASARLMPRPLRSRARPGPAARGCQFTLHAEDPHRAVDPLQFQCLPGQDGQRAAPCRDITPQLALLLRFDDDRDVSSITLLHACRVRLRWRGATCHYNGSRTDDRSRNPVTEIVTSVLQMEKRCIFCGNPPSAKNKEHIIPKWLIELTGDPKREWYLGVKFGEPGKPPRVFSADQFQFPACESCNSRYSNLEGRARGCFVKLWDNKPLTAGEWDDLLDWFDKVRIGLFIGNTYWSIRSQITTGYASSVAAIQFSSTCQLHSCFSLESCFSSTYRQIFCLRQEWVSHFREA
jgi:hypothetical protein